MYARRRHVYFAMMGLCLSLFVVACAVVRLWSVPAAVAMCVVAMVIPPFAAVVANRKGPEDRWYDDPGAGSASGQAEEPPTPPTHVRKKDPRDGPGTPPVKPPLRAGRVRLHRDLRRARPRPRRSRRAPGTPLRPGPGQGQRPRVRGVVAGTGPAGQRRGGPARPARTRPRSAPAGALAGGVAAPGAGAAGLSRRAPAPRPP
ncbi:DUF3099 domain-containing protein [Streptomyces albidoflavus]